MQAVMGGLTTPAILFSSLSTVAELTIVVVGTPPGTELSFGFFDYGTSDILLCTKKARKGQ
jgi:hypothetical protein